jgi:MFS family permease
MSTMPQNFSSQNLIGKSFKGQDFTGADFSHSDIRGANFTKTILINANFRHVKSGLRSSPWLVLIVGLILLIAAAIAMIVTKSIIVSDAPVDIKLAENMAIVTGAVATISGAIVIRKLPLEMVAKLGFFATVVALVFSAISANFLLDLFQGERLTNNSEWDVSPLAQLGIGAIGAIFGLVAGSGMFALTKTSFSQKTKTTTSILTLVGAIAGFLTAIFDGGNLLLFLLIGILFLFVLASSISNLSHIFITLTSALLGFIAINMGKIAVFLPLVVFLIFLAIFYYPSVYSIIIPIALFCSYIINFTTEQTSFRGADLRYASFTQAILTNTDFREAKIENTDFTGAQMK